MWLEDDTESALRYMDYLASLCSGCGNVASETMSEEMSGAYEAVPLNCFACAARDAEQRVVSEARANKKYSESAFDGLYIGVKRCD